jgi:hypothetical protein
MAALGHCAEVVVGGGWSGGDTLLPRLAAAHIHPRARVSGCGAARPRLAARPLAPPLLATPCRPTARALTQTAPLRQSTGPTAGWTSPTTTPRSCACLRRRSASVGARTPSGPASRYARLHPFHANPTTDACSHPQPRTRKRRPPAHASALSHPALPPSRAAVAGEPQLHAGRWRIPLLARYAPPG